MAQPVFERAAVYQRGAGFHGSISNATATVPELFDVGAGPSVGVVVRVLASTDDIVSVVFGGVTLTALAQITNGTGLKERMFYGVGLSLTGGQAWTATLNAANSSIVQAHIYAARNVTAATFTAPVNVGGETLNFAVPTNSNSIAVGMLGVGNSGGGYTNAATGPTVERAETPTNSNTGYIVERPGAGSSVNLQASSTGNTFTPGFDGHAVSLEGVSAAPVLTSPTGTPTGNTTATAGFTTDQAVSGALPAYFLTLPAATAAPADAATLIANGATVSQTTGGTTPTRALTGLTTDTAVRTHMCQPGSNVVSSASYTPPTMASSGSLAAQSGTASTTFAWTGATPESQITAQGIGSSAWTLTSAGGSGLSTINSSTGVPGGTLTATPGVYTVTVTKTDSSTAGTNPTGGGAPPQTIVRTATLTVSAAPSGPTINTHPSNQTAKIGATATFNASATASSGSLTAQWQKDAANIGGATNATSYARAGVVLGDHGGAFRCGYSDAAGGPVYTNPATLTVAVTFINGPVPAQSGAVGVAASWDFSSYFAGGLSRTFAILSGALPAGMAQVGSTAVFSGTPSAAGSGSIVIRATDSAANTDQTGTISWTIAALATTLSVTLTTDGVAPAANLTGLKVAVYDQPTPDLWAGQQPIYTTAAGTTNGSGVFTCSIAGLTALAPGGIAGVAISNSDGTTTQGAAQKGYVGPVVVS